ncbi:MAG: hypothetical protein QMD14_04935, partial [Candidatus Aenigmarchaeota archaeon]|nr:hypothetical protein [Candidatus Aenigmarchaeota archaeon]
TEVSSTSTAWELKKQVKLVPFSSSYGLKPRYINVIARLRNDPGGTGNDAYLNVTLENLAGAIVAQFPVQSTTSASYALVSFTSPDLSGVEDGLYNVNVYMRVAAATGYNDLIDFYWVE